MLGSFISIDPSEVKWYIVNGKLYLIDAAKIAGFSGVGRTIREKKCALSEFHSMHITFHNLHEKQAYFVRYYSKINHFLYLFA